MRSIKVRETYFDSKKLQSLQFLNHYDQVIQKEIANDLLLTELS